MNIWTKIDTLWGEFEDSRIGKFVLRKKSYISFMYTSTALVVAQLSLLNSQNYLIDIVQKQIDTTEGFWHYFWIVVSYVVPEGNIGIIIALALVMLAVSLVRYRELLPYTLQKLFTSDSLKQYDIHTIGRDKDKDAIATLFEKNNVLVLINSMGGIGKSVLARYYYTQTKEQYDYSGFIVAEEKLEENFVASMLESMPLSATSTEGKFIEALGLLARQTGKKLLIIDNIKDVHRQQESLNKLMALSDHGFDILFTSRQSMDGVSKYALAALEMSDAIELFVYHCPSKERGKIEQILNYIDRHTLFTEIIAKTVHKNSYTLDDIINKFEDGSLAEISVVDQNSGTEETLNKNLKALFDMQELEEPYVNLLQCMALFPSVEISIEVLEKFMQTENLKGRLNFLVAQGWLSVDEKGAYKLHEIIKVFIVANHLPSLETIERPYHQICQWARQSSASDNAKQKYLYLSYFDSFSAVFERLKLADEKVGVFYANVGTLYFHTSDYPTALEYLTKSLAISQEIGDKAGEGATLNNIATAHHANGDYPTALKYLTKSLAISQEIGDKAGEGATLNNISGIYDAQGDYPTALEYLTKSLAIQEEIGDKAGEGATLNNLSQIYDTQGDYPTALEYLTKSLAISQEIGDKAGMCATLFNMGHMALQNDERDKAMAYWKQVYTIATAINQAQALDALTGLAEQLGLEGGLDAWGRV